MNDRIEKVHRFWEENGISHQTHYHPPLPTIELALEYWKEIDSTHCKNLFFRNHKGNRHYLVYKSESTTNMRQLTDEERVAEIANMLSGENVTEAAIAQAKILLGR